MLRYLTVKVEELEDGPSVLMHARTSREERSRRHDDGRRGRDDDRPRDRDETAPGPTTSGRIARAAKRPGTPAR